MKKMIKIGIVFIVLGLLTLFIAWAKSGFGLSIDSLKNIDAVNLQSSQTKKVSQFKSININTSADVTVKTGDTFKVISRTPKGVSIHSKLDGDQLNVTQSGQASKHNRLGLIIINGDADDLNGNVTIYVPSNWQLNHINQESGNNSLNLEHLMISSGLTLHGEIDINNVTARYLKATTDSDDVSVTNSQFQSGKSDIITTSGDAEINNVNFDELAKVQSESGDVDITKLKAENKITLVNSSSGDVTVHHSQFNTLKLASDSGDIDFKDLDIKNRLDAMNDNGDIAGKLIDDDHAHIKTSNDNGDTDIKKSLNDVHSSKQYYFSNTSGDIDVD